MPIPNQALQGLQGVTFNMSDPRNKMPRRYDPSQVGPQSIQTPKGGMATMGDANLPADSFSSGLDLRDELSQNLANTPASDQYGVNRLKQLLMENQKGLDGSIIPEQAQLVNQWRADDAAARTAGFGSMGTDPMSSGQSAAQSREIYKRAQEQEKMRQPMAIAQTHETGETERRRMEDAGALQRSQVAADATIKQAQIPADVRTQGYKLLSDAMGVGSGGKGGLPPGSSMSLSGIGSTRTGAATAPPNAAFDRIRQARMEYETAKQGDGWFDGDNGTSIAKKSLDDAVMGYFGQYKGTNPLAKSKAADLYKDPDFFSPDTTIEDLMDLLMESDPNALDALGEDGMLELEEMLTTVRGGK